MDGGESSSDEYQRPTDEQASGSTDTMGAAAAYLLMKKGKRGAAAIIAAECEVLDNMLFENMSKQEKLHQSSLEVSMEEEQIKNADEPSASDSSEESSDQDSYDSTDSDSDADINAVRQLSRCRLLDQLLDILLNPLNAISNVGVSGGELDWIRWLMAGGKTLDEFTNLVKQYDYGTCCGLVWTANYVAYRCRTCSISPCMSLCADCFKAGDHAQHDFNMFRSQAGGACDCGDTSVMKADGFCRNHSHGSSSSKKYKKPPLDLLRVAERLMPRLLLRLVQYLRENSDASGDLDPNKHEGGAMPGLSAAVDHTRPVMNIGGGGAVPGLPLPGGAPVQQHQVHFQHQAHHLQQNAQINTLNKNLDDLQPFLSVLHDLSALGAAMRRLMTVSLTDERIYKWACDYYYNNNASIQGNSSHSVVFKGEEPKTQQNFPSFSCTASSTVNTMYTTYADRVRALYTQALRQYNIGIGGTPEPVVSENTTATGHSLAHAWPYGDASSSSSSSSSLDSSSSSSSDDEDEYDPETSQGMEVEMEQTTGVHLKKTKMRRKNKSNGSNKNKYLSHSTFLQEIVFWTVRYEFPQKIVCFLLNMLPDATYKRCLTEAFTSHYGCVARVLAATRDSDTLSNHIVHISVQLFSNESLAKRMVVRHQLLKVMVKSLRGMMNDILIPSTLHVPSRNRHKVVDCSKPVMKEHCYWPLVSDLNNVLSHRPIAVRFMRDDRLLRSWFSYLSVFQGMNVNCRELGHHVEFEPNTYYAAFSAELEASAYPMWAMLSHLSLTSTKSVSKVNENDAPHSSNADKVVVKKRSKKSKHSTEDSETLKLSKRVLKACLKRLLKWLRDVHGEKEDVNWGLKSYVKDTSDYHQFTFHLPLHRYLAVFLCQAIRTAHQQQMLLRKNPSQVEYPRLIRNLLDELLSEVFPSKDNSCTENYTMKASTTAAAQGSVNSPTSNENDKLMDGILLKIAQHPLRAQAAFYEIMTQGAWVRNGLQIKGQAMTYVQSNFCISMVDADIYLLQLCLSEISDVPSYMRLVLDKFKADEWMKPAIVNGSQGLPAMMKGASGSPGNGSDNGNDGSPGTGNGNEAEAGVDYNGAINDITPSALESLLVFLATLVSVRTNLCTDEDYNYCQTQLEMVTLLCVSDKTHSQLMELMPERCGGGGSTNTGATTSSSAGSSTSTTATTANSSDRDFETVLQAVAEYKRPQYERSSGTMQQGLYVPKGSTNRSTDVDGNDNSGSDVWLKLFDPIHVLLRAVHRRDFQSSMDRYTAFVRSKGLLSNRNLQYDASKSSTMSSSSSVCSSSSSSSSTIPWPPYRTPRRHHPAYQDPRRLLLESPAWHAVVWHSLYRAARGSRDISEHTLSLLVYLLDQSVALYQERQERKKSENSNKAVSQQQDHNVGSEMAMGISHEPRSKQDEPMETDTPQIFQYQPGEIKREEFIDKKEGTDVIGDTEDTVCPKRRVRMDNDNENVTECNVDGSQSLLERWYSSEDLLVNLRTVITHIDLPKRKEASALESSRSHENNKPSTSIGTMTSGSVNFLDYFGGALSSASTSAFRDQPQNINQQQSNSSFIPMIAVPSLASLASDEIPSSTATTAPSISLSIRPAANLFNTAMSPFYSHNNTSTTATTTTSANATSSTSTSITDAALNVVKHHLQFLSNAGASVSVEGDLSQLPILKQDLLQSEPFDQGTCHSLNAAALAQEEQKYEHVDNDESVPVDESIISLLLRLHSQLSGRPDSYHPPSIPTNDINSQQEYEPGDGAHYVGKLLDRIASIGGGGPSGVSLSYECVTRARNTLWPRAVVAREAATRDLEERERRERKRRAHDKQRRMMEEMARAQRAFIENARLSGELELSNSVQTSTGDDLTTHARQPSSNSFSMEYEEETPASTVTPMVTETSPTSNELPNVITQQQDNANQLISEVADETKHINVESAKSGVENYLFNTVFETAVDCVICNQTVTVSEQQRLDPVGLVILVQGTNILAHRRRRRKREQRVTPSTFSGRVSSGKCRRICGEQGSGQVTAGAVADAATVDILQHGEDVMMVEPEEDSENYSDWPSLPPSPSKQHHNQFSLLQCTPQDASTLHDNTADGGVDNSTSTYGAYMDRKRQLLNQHFMNLDITVTDLQVGAGRTVGGVHVQTCGHHLHLRCWRSYLASLRGAQRYASDRGEYSCPLCRQLANSVLPLTNYDFRLSLLQLRPTRSTSPMGHYMETIASLVQYLQRQQRAYRQHLKTVVPPQQMTSSSILSSRIMGVLSDTSVIPRVEEHHTVGSSNIGVYNYYSLEQDPLTDAINRCVDDMITSGNSSIGSSMSAAAAANPNISNTSNTTWQSIVSVAWTNIQVELVQRDNSLLPPSGTLNVYHQSGSKSVEGYHYYDMLPKRSCTAPLLRVLNARARRLINDPDQENVLSEIWSQLTGQDYPIMPKKDMMDIRQKQLPLMLRDPCSVLLQLVLLLPPSIERNLFDTLVKLLYNMQLYATALKVAVSSTSSLYDNYKETGSSESSQNVADNTHSVFQNKSYFIRAVYLAKTMVLHRKTIDDDENKDDISDANEFVLNDECDMSSTNKILSEKDLESYARQCSLPFLRFATLLCRHIYGGNDDQLFAHLQFQEMVEDSKSRTKKTGQKQFSRDDYEFQMLVRHLRLVDSDGKTMPMAMEACNWPVQSQNDSSIAISWFFTVRQSLRKIASTTNNDDDGPLLMMTARQLLAVDDDENDTTTSDAGVTAVNWTGPRLLRLPHLYDDVFQYYHGRPCHRCHGVPRETSVCLVCGTVVCLKENCCKTDNVCEAVQHSIECGGGTAMFLVVTSSSVVVIRGKRACLWGSVYLDAFGEEDRELKRGKPLYLSAERYRLLERQWLAHRFDHTNKKWVWHREQL